MRRYLANSLENQGCIGRMSSAVIDLWSKARKSDFDEGDSYVELKERRLSSKTLSMLAELLLGQSICFEMMSGIRKEGDNVL